MCAQWMPPQNQPTDLKMHMPKIEVLEVDGGLALIPPPDASKSKLPYSNDLPMYDLCEGSTRVKLEYDPSKVNRKIRNCAKYLHSASQSAKSAEAAAAAASSKPIGL